MSNTIIDKLVTKEHLAPKTFEKEVGEEVFHVKEMLSLEDALSFVENAVSLAIDNETGLCLPELEEFAFNAALIAYYTDLELPDDIEATYQFTLRDELMGLIYGSANSQQIIALRNGFEAELNKKKQLENLSPTDEFFVQAKKLVSDLSEMVSGVGKLVENTEPSQIEEIVAGLADLLTVNTADDSDESEYKQ